jgi:ubiquinone/menaquinone biosynthesis C-methylase UbiE
MEFYEEIADQYDEMTRFHERVYKETAMLNLWIDRYGFSTALDVACGTGIHTIAMASLGVRMVGIDISEAMLGKAKIHAEEFEVQVVWVHASMQQLRQHLHDKYQAIFCLGNSISHLLQQSDLDAAAENFYELLNPEGVLVIQLLNYHRILADRNRIVDIHRRGDTEYIRFYDFHQDRILFNLLTIQFCDEVCTHSLHTTPLYPYQKDELERGLSKYGFTDLEYYGDMQFHLFHEQASPNLVIVGRKR